MNATGYLIATNVPSSDWRAVFPNAPAVIGRGSTAAIRVPRGNPWVSRKHAKIWADRFLWIVDLGSTQGTRINGVLLKPQQPTKVIHGDRILLGHLELQVVAESDIRDSVLADGGDCSNSKDDTLRMLRREALIVNGHPALSVLSNAERDVLLWMTRGYTNLDEIGKKLFRSPSTVRTQLNSIFQKLEVHSRDELMGLLMRLQMPDSE